MSNKIGVVLVTFNRIDMLKKALEKFESQTIVPQYIIVVNNNSSDGTYEYLEEWKMIESNYEKIVLQLCENTGGSGGFFAGLEEALKHDAGWVWVSDDDAFPEETTIENAHTFLTKQENTSNIAAICAKVINNGEIDQFHRSNVKLIGNKVKMSLCDLSCYDNEYFELNQFSYVGTIMNIDFLKKYGITKKELFIFYDDSEHAYRLSKHGKILCVPSIIVHHDAKNGEITDWKLYYRLRNLLIFYKEINEKAFYYEYRKQKFKLFIKKIIRYKPEKFELINTALTDAKNNKLGKHDIYKPGWKFKK